jgi:hypothetical protein
MICALHHVRNVHSCVRQPLWWNKNVPRPTLIEALDLLDLVVARSSTFAFGGAKSKIQATRSSTGTVVRLYEYSVSVSVLYVPYSCTGTRTAATAVHATARNSLLSILQDLQPTATKSTIIVDYRYDSTAVAACMLRVWCTGTTTGGTAAVHPRVHAMHQHAICRRVGPAASSSPLANPPQPTPSPPFHETVCPRYGQTRRRCAQRTHGHPVAWRRAVCVTWRSRAWLARHMPQQK